MLLTRPFVRLPLAIAVALALVCLAATAGCRRGVGARGPHQGGVVVALGRAPGHLDPRMGTDLASVQVAGLLFNGLLARDPQGNLVPDLAASWEVLDDGRRYRFHLRRGVTFHDGRPLTSTDVVWTLESVRDGSAASPKRSVLDPVERFIAVDEHTVDCLLGEPFGSLLVELTSSLGIVPRGSQPAEIDARPVGSGPFRLVEHSDERWVLAPFAAYRDTPPALERVELKVVPDATVRALELLKGSVQLVVNELPPDLVPRFRDDPAFRVVADPGAVYAYLGLNLEHPALADPRVRRALALGIDRELLARALWRGQAVVTDTLLPPGLWAYHADLPRQPYDPLAAARLLDEAGYPDPDGAGPAPRLAFTYKTSTDETAYLQAQVIQQMLAEVGVELSIRSYEFATFYDDVRRGAFEIFSLNRVGIIDPNIYRFVLHSASIPPAGQNRGRYRNPRFDHLIDRAAGLTDPTERRPLYLEAQEILARDLPYISLFHRKNVAVMAAGLAGYRNYLGGELTSLAGMHWQRSGASTGSRAGRRAPGLDISARSRLSSRRLRIPQSPAFFPSGGDMNKKASAVSEPYTKSQVMSAIAEDTGLSKKEVSAVFDSLKNLIHRHLRSRGAGTFTLPGLAKISVQKKAATKARKGINPFTGEETTFKAKPARRVVKVRPLKGLKDLAE